MIYGIVCFLDYTMMCTLIQYTYKYLSLGCWKQHFEHNAREKEKEKKRKERYSNECTKRNKRTKLK